MYNVLNISSSTALADILEQTDHRLEKYGSDSPVSNVAADTPGQRYHRTNGEVYICNSTDGTVGGTVWELVFDPTIRSFTERSEPSDPANGESVMWVSNGTGTGSSGDLMMKITSSSVTKTVTLIDFSAS